MFGSTMIYKVLSIEPMGKVIDSLGELQSMTSKKIYIVKNSFVDDVVSDIESLREMESLGYFIATGYSLRENNLQLKNANNPEQENTTKVETFLLPCDWFI